MAKSPNKTRPLAPHDAPSVPTTLQLAATAVIDVASAAADGGSAQALPRFPERDLDRSFRPVHGPGDRVNRGLIAVAPLDQLALRGGKILEAFLDGGLAKERKGRIDVLLFEGLGHRVVQALEVGEASGALAEVLGHAAPGELVEPGEEALDGGAAAGFFDDREADVLKDLLRGRPVAGQGEDETQEGVAALQEGLHQGVRLQCHVRESGSPAPGRLPKEAENRPATMAPWTIWLTR